jgi:N-acetylglucosaminyl-diphospho-decaprenol L-rhamnosyltransferase
MPVVLVISYSGILGGAERILLDFAGGLDSEVCLACPDGALARAARTAGIRVLGLREREQLVRGSARNGLLAVRELLGHAREARRLIRDLDPAVVIAWGMRPALATLLGPRPAAPIVFQHNDLLPGPPIGRVVRAAARRADLVVVLSHAIAEDLDPGGGLGDRLVVVHPGVDVGQFQLPRRPASPPEVLVLGALVDWKRPDLALEACSLARRQCPELRIRIVGGTLDEGGERLLARLRRRAEEPDLSGAVEFAGTVADPYDELRQATCLLHCAPREPFGLAVLEALAAGVPAVAPAAGGPSEIVDEECGILYEPGNAAAAAKALVAVARDPVAAQRMGAHGRFRARERFDREGARSRFAAAVASVMRTRPSDRAPRRLTLLTVTHDSAPELDALLRSVERHLPGAKVVVVDCASCDHSLSLARRPREVAVDVVELSENVGFGRACNVGMASIRDPVTALLNPDVELLDDSLRVLAEEALRRDRPERLLAPLVLRPDGSRQDSVHPLPTSAADLARAVIPPAAAPGRLGVHLAPWRSRSPRQVGWAVGCALVARTETLRRLGPFDERIFLYGEDLDLGLAAAAQGVQSWFWPSGRVLHHGAHSTSAAFGGEPFERLARARHQAVLRHLGPRRARLDDAAQAVTFASRIALKRALGRSTGRERRQLEALAHVVQAAG